MSLTHSDYISSDASTNVHITSPILSIPIHPVKSSSIILILFQKFKFQFYSILFLFQFPFLFQFNRTYKF